MSSAKGGWRSQEGRPFWMATGARSQRSRPNARWWRHDGYRALRQRDRRSCGDAARGTPWGGGSAHATDGLVDRATAVIRPSHSPTQRQSRRGDGGDLGLRGPPPKPTRIRMLEGNRARRPLPANEPQYPPGVAERPSGMSSGGKKIWDTLVREMAASGVLRTVDALALMQDRK